MILVALSGFAYVLFAWSSAHIDTAVTSSVFQLWVCGWFFAMRGIDAHRVGSRVRSTVPARVYALGVAALGGCVLTVMSAGLESSDGGSVTVGAALAVLATVVDRIIYGSGAKNDPWRDTVLERFTVLEVEETICVSMLAVGRLITVPVVVLVAMLVAASPATILSWSFAGGAFAGGLLLSPGGYLTRRALFMCDRREILAVQYLEPALAVLWLWLWRGFEVPHPALLVGGVAVVTASNLSMHIARRPAGLVSSVQPHTR